MVDWILSLRAASGTRQRTVRPYLPLPGWVRRCGFRAPGIPPQRMKMGVRATGWRVIRSMKWCV